MEFKLPLGPWEKLFEGSFQGHSMEMHINQDSLLLVAIFDEKKGKKVGTILELFKVFFAEGELSSFIETLQREAVSITKHDEKNNYKFFLLGSKPSYVSCNEEKFDEELFSLAKKLEKSSKMLLDVASAYDLVLTELSKADKEIRASFFVQPLIVPGLSTAVSSERIAESIPHRQTMHGEMILGVTASGALVKEPLSLFRTTVVESGSKKDRARFLHIMSESALLSGVTTIIFDWRNMFSGLSEASKNSPELKKYKIDADPIGFPVKDFSVPENITVDLSAIDEAGFTELLGLEKTTAGKIIQKEMQKKKAKNLPELASGVYATETSDEFNEYQILRAGRILKLADKTYEGLFREENYKEELAKRWLKGLGRASVIHLEACDDRTAFLVFYTVLMKLAEFCKKSALSGEMGLMIVLPEAERIFSAYEKNSMFQKAVSAISQLSEMGCGFSFGVERKGELPGELQKKFATTATIVRGRDIGIKVQNRKPYRVRLRSGLSQAVEL